MKSILSPDQTFLIIKFFPISSNQWKIHHVKLAVYVQLALSLWNYLSDMFKRSTFLCFVNIFFNRLKNYLNIQWFFNLIVVYIINFLHMDLNFSNISHAKKTVCIKLNFWQKKPRIQTPAYLGCILFVQRRRLPYMLRMLGLRRHSHSESWQVCEHWAHQGVS